MIPISVAEYGRLIRALEAQGAPITDPLISKLSQARSRERQRQTVVEAGRRIEIAEAAAKLRGKR